MLIYNRILKRLERKLDDIMFNMERSRFKEYVEYIHDRKRMLKNAFLFGIARGLGTAVGFTLLGALLIYLLRILAESSIPILGDFIARIIEIVETKT
ncbi:MAG: DUF5665 domain-containing protein [Eubacteriales bacterium]|nr:DUF5665 domain-containing protein [Eubacteriales bacterium]